MKTSRILVSLSGAALLLSSVAYAREGNKGKVELNETVIADGKTINSGQYTVEWTGTGPSVQVTLLQGKQTVATFPAHLAEQATSAGQNAYGTSLAPDGSRELTAIYLGAKRIVLQLDKNEASQQSSTQDTK
jgi:hypothetical protein